MIPIKPKRIAFGFYAGECVGNCGTIYEMTTKKLMVDTSSFWQTQSDLSKLQIKEQRYLEKDDEGNLMQVSFQFH